MHMYIHKHIQNPTVNDLIFERLYFKKKLTLCMHSARSHKLVMSTHIYTYVRIFKIRR